LDKETRNGVKVKEGKKLNSLKHFTQQRYTFPIVHHHEPRSLFNQPNHVFGSGQH
jgi:hypothetical protein